MIELAEEVPSSMVPELRSWVQFPPVTQFSVARIPPSLASAGPARTVASEQEQAAPIATDGTQEGECWTIIRDPLTPSISPEFYGWTGREGAV
jgi:hypothetical protein